jgi:hypothetical protein
MLRKRRSTSSWRDRLAQNPDRQGGDSSQQAPQLVRLSKLQAKELTRPMSSPAQIAANQANAQLSTGPKTAEGKAKSSRNAVKTGLTGHTILLPADQAELYEKHLLAYVERFDPQGDFETELVQAIADCRWRLARIPGLESALYARGQIEFGPLFENYDEKQRAALIAGETFARYRRDFMNLLLQEQRLTRRAQKETETLQAIQAKRIEDAENARLLSARLYLAAKQANKPFDPSEFGFEFSVEDIQGFIKGMELRQAADKIKLAS